ncbi:MAG: DUF4124 domain-containing protein, partial [Pseudomonadota bacterium]|nr:DUF4124 domain-containing protein [Pseudomonadota bacterium]
MISGSGKFVYTAVGFGLLMVLAGPGSAKIYKWVDENGQVHFSDRQDHRVEQEEVRVTPVASDWSRFEIDIRTVDVELSDEELGQIEGGVNNVYEFFDRVLSFDMIRTVPVNILILKDSRAYRNYLI